MADDLATSPAEFWERRRDLTPEPGAFGGESARHLVFLADVGDALTDARAGLDQFDCLDVAPPAYHHVTVTVVGNVGEAITADAEARIRDAARDAFADIDAFDVSFPRYNLFPTVVYAEVDGGRFAALNDRACAIDDVPVHGRDDAFVPHATLAQFTGDSDYDELLDFLEANRSLDATATVDEVQLVAVDPSVRFPEFETVESYPLQ